MRNTLDGESYTYIRIHLLNSAGDWKETKEKRFPIPLIPGDFITLSDGIYEVLKRVVHVFGETDWDATVTAKQTNV
jgi:hypothetical protein